MNVTDYIKVFDGALSSDECSALISLFESNIDKQERYENNGYPNFTQLNLSLHFKNNPIHDNLIKKAEFFKEKYAQETNSRLLPTDYKWEQFRIKKYRNNGEDRFDEHIDASSLQSCKRFLVIFWYLNDVEEGGETIFTDPLDIKIKCKTGRILMFPPMWMYPHAGLAPKSNNKYIIGSYLNF